MQYEKKIEELENRVNFLSKSYNNKAPHYNHITNNVLSNLYAMKRLSMHDSFSRGVKNLKSYLEILESNHLIREQERNHPGKFGNKDGLNNSIKYLDHFLNSL